jgi:hypothetical protein
MPGTTDAHADDPRIAIKRPPLALDPKDAIAKIEREVVSPMFSSWLKDLDPELDRVRGDHCLGDSAFVIRRMHEHMFGCDPDGEDRKQSRMRDEVALSV